MNLSTIATSKNLTILGICLIVKVVAIAAIAVFDGDPATVVNWDVTFTSILAGVGMILGKGQASTGGTIPETPEAAARLKAVA
jgi:hypothetical protein